MGGNRPAESGGKAGDGKCQSFVAIQPDAIGARRDIILADGALLAVEADFLNKIMGYLGINPEEGKRVMEVMLIKNRF